MQKLIERLRHDEDGAALLEYSMLVGLIAVVSIVTVQTFGQTVSGYFSYISASIPAV